MSPGLQEKAEMNESNESAQALTEAWSWLDQMP